MPAAAIIDRLPQPAKRFDEIGSIDLGPKQPGKAFEQPRYIASGSLVLDRHRNRVSVIFDKKQQRQVLETCCVERFPKLALAGCTFTSAHECDFIRSGIEIVLPFSAPGSLKKLRARRRG